MDMIWVSQQATNMNEALTEWLRVTEWQGQVIGYAAENVSNETEMLLMGAQCEVCEHCGALAFKAEKKTNCL
jgi:hypothetical protein